MDIAMVRLETEAKFIPVKEEDDEKGVIVKLERRELSVLPNIRTANDMDVDPGIKLERRELSTLPNSLTDGMDVDSPAAPEIGQFHPKTHKFMNRQRLFLAAVEVPTLQFVRRVKRLPEDLTIKQIDAKIKSLDNPLVKKKEGVAFSLDTIRDRLLTIGLDLFPIPLDRSIRDVDITRQFLSQEYGGNTQDTFPRIRKEKFQEHGLDDFMCFNLDLNPCAPTTPGAPGLFFTLRRRAGEPWPKIQRVMCRLSSSKWLYQGQYKMAPSESLTKEEWAQESQKVRNTWVKRIYTTGWGYDVKVRISLRKRLGRTFTEQELQDEYDSGREYKNVTLEDIHDALLKGEETMGVWTMKCVGYDVAFQTNLATKFPTWVPPPPKEKKKNPRMSKKLTSTLKKGKFPKSKVETESELSELTLSDEDIVLPDDPSEVVSLHSDQEELPYIPQGTRSQPIEL